MHSYFYHSYPRRSRDDRSSNIDHAFAVTELMLSVGLLLTPERVQFDGEIFQDGTHADGIDFFQKRICFTELRREELLVHCENFGAFSLEFDVADLRNLGILPVFYLIPDSGEAGDFSGLGISLLHRLLDIRESYRHLAQIKTLADRFDPNSAVVLNGHAFAMTWGALGALIDFIHPRLEFADPALDGLSGLFYPTDGERVDTALTYYRQREWRILGNALLHGAPLTIKLEKEQKSRILETDPDFFARSYPVPSGPSRIVDQCQYLPSEVWVPKLNRLIVPREVVDRAREQFGPRLGERIFPIGV